MTKVTAIIPAAGSGRRMGGDTSKQFLLIGGQPLIAETLSVFERSTVVDNVILVAPADEIETSKKIVEEKGFTKVSKIVEGGKERQDSIKNGINILDGDTEIVIVHDGVRPFITEEMIELSVETARKAGAAIVAVPVKDTVKKSKDSHIVNTVPRENLWLAQTPQTFQYSIIKEAYLQAEINSFRGTDDSSLVEAMGKNVKIVSGTYENIKITTPEDLVFAEAIIKNRSKK